MASQSLCTEALRSPEAICAPSPAAASSFHRSPGAEDHGGEAKALLEGSYTDRRGVIMAPNPDPVRPQQEAAEGEGKEDGKKRAREVGRQPSELLSVDTGIPAQVSREWRQLLTHTHPRSTLDPPGAGATQPHSVGLPLPPPSLPWGRAGPELSQSPSATRPPAPQARHSRRPTPPHLQ